MADCEMIARCPFFNDKMANKPGTAMMMKKRYCQGNNADCARYVVCKGLGRDKVPADLYPVQIDRARDMVKKGR